MRILHVVESMAGGVARHLADLLPEQAAQGHEVELIYSPGRADRATEAALVRLAGVPSATVDMAREVGLHDLASLRALRREIAGRAPYDILHGHSSKAGALVRLLPRAISKGAPRVYTPHALITMAPELSPRRRALFTRIERALARRGDRIIAVSAQEADHARELGLAAAKIRTVLHGIPLGETAPGARAAARKSLGLDEATPVVGFVGRLWAQKAPEIALRAFAASTPRPDAVLLMAGYGSQEASLREEVRALGMEDRVRLLGDADGPALMPAFDVYLLTSRYESFGYVVLEAAAAGAALVATPTGVVPDLVEDGASGLLVPVDDVAATTAALDRMLGDPAFRKRTVTALAERLAPFDAATMARATVAVYEEAIRHRRP